jgi:hypothetical protein
MAGIKNLVLFKKEWFAVIYNLFEKYYSRTLPAMVRQSADTQIRSTNFNIASKAGRTLHNGLLSVIPFPKDRFIQSKFSATIAKWLQLQSVQDIHPQDDIPYICNFQFNSNTSIEERFHTGIMITKRDNNFFEIAIPSFIPVDSIFAPDKTISVEFKITIAGCFLESGTPAGNHTASFMVTWNDKEVPGQIITLPFKKLPGNLIVIAAALTFNLFSEGKVVKCMEPLFMPCTILKSMYC